MGVLSEVLRVKRREFITLVGGAVDWPLGARPAGGAWMSVLG